MNLDGHFLTFQEAEDACATIGVLEGLIKNKIIVILTCLLFLSGVWHAAQEWTISDARSQIKEFEQVDLITVEYVNIMDEYNQKLFNLFQFQNDILSADLKGEYDEEKSAKELAQKIEEMEKMAIETNKAGKRVEDQKEVRQQVMANLKFAKKKKVDTDEN